VGLTEVLRTELERFGIGVTAVCPGGVKTPIFENMKVKGFRKEATVPHDFVVGSLERAAKKIVRAVKKNQAVLVFTAFATATYGIKRFSPALTRQLNRAFLKHLLKDKI
jgi:short-subunit dehydrogenase